MSDSLATYLNDHLAGSEGALELLENLGSHAASDSFRAELDRLYGDIEDDQGTLRKLLARLGVRESPLKRALGWLAEKATRLKLGAPRKDAEGLALLESLEVLALGIHGKLGLWRALAVVQPREPLLAELDLDALAWRASDQHERVDRLRLVAAATVLRPPRNGVPSACSTPRG